MFTERKAILIASLALVALLMHGNLDLPSHAIIDAADGLSKFICQDLGAYAATITGEGAHDEWTGGEHDCGRGLLFSINASGRAIWENGCGKWISQRYRAFPDLDQSDVYGSWPNPTGNPIGGGAGYDRIITRDQATYTVRDAPGLLEGLGRARSGEIVYIEDGAEIELTGASALRIPAGVTLASGRGLNGSKGGRIYSSSGHNSTLLIADGDGVRVTGIRLQGPDQAQSRLTYRMIGISSRYAGDILVDNCEIYGWSHAAVQIGRNTEDAKVLNNYIHHNQVRGLGYGVALVGGGKNHALVEGNLFDSNRHSIAGAGNAGSSYEARYNTVLEQSGGSHSFDMHGGRDRKDGTDIAGEYEKIHHNTFKDTAHPGVRIRGVPVKGAWIYNNWFYDPIPSQAVQQVHSKGNFYVYNNLYGM